MEILLERADEMTVVFFSVIALGTVVGFGLWVYTKLTEKTRRRGF